MPNLDSPIDQIQKQMIIIEEILDRCRGNSYFDTEILEDKEVDKFNEWLSESLDRPPNYNLLYSGTRANFNFQQFQETCADDESQTVNSSV